MFLSLYIYFKNQYFKKRTEKKDGLLRVLTKQLVGGVGVFVKVAAAQVRAEGGQGRAGLPPGSR